ncbi:MAG: hypothetical protein M3Y48_11990 [Actinomycetota bacterium]|nr:hypothetical protein [Actinomycetota bacterium]
MRTSSLSLCRSGSARRRIDWRWSVIGWIAVVVLLASGCATRPVETDDNPSVISYAGAASRLDGLDPAEAQEQLRDWARTGLAAHLKLDAAQFRDALYDTVPVRDQAFADLSRQSTGPGRALFDGRGVLHVLVQQGDPHESRTIGLLIDQYRADAGADPQQVQIHHYQIRPDTQTIELTPEKPEPTAQVRSAHGFVTMRIDDPKGLTDFLARSRHLSWLEVRDKEIWAGGWNWPDVPAVPLDSEDVSVIQRGYLQPDAPLPAFSLDPGPAPTRDDILAVVPDLRPELADRLVSQDWAGTPFRSAEGLAMVVDGALFQNDPAPAVLAGAGLPSDSSQLWALHNLLNGHPLYSQARNDGQLEGTKVGMTLFYSDKVAKDWVAGVGTGVPTQAVGGFIPNSGADIPWSHCDGAEILKGEYGRLWFGQNDSGFTFDAGRVSIGPQATRLFSRSDADGGTEVEPSFGFGRGMRWWDQHFQAVADYEPQYQRLDEIMRWSGALEWLTIKTPVTLPQLDDAAIQSDLRFHDWYAQHSELRERSPIDFVTPPSAQHEAIRTKPSAVYQTCGLLGIFGGVSLGDVIEREGNRSFHAELPGPVRRDGLFDETSRFDEATGTGRINQLWLDPRGQVTDNLQRTFSTTADGRNVDDVAATGRQVAPLGGLKVWRATTATWQYKLEMTVRPGLVSQRVEFQNQELGELVARSEVTDGVDSVTIQWRRGPLDRARRALESIQNRLLARPAAGLPVATDGVLSSFQDASGRTLYKIGGPDDPWLTITNEVPPPGDELALRLGVPDPRTGEAQFLLGRFVPHPDVPPVDGGPPWMEVTPPTGDHPSRIIAAVLPSRDVHTVRVTTPDRSTTISQLGDRVWVRYDDPVFGVDGTAEGTAMLRDFSRVNEAMGAATAAGDGLLRGVPLGDDGVALAGTGEVFLVRSDHPWAGRVREAIGPVPSPQLLLFRIEGAHLLQVDPGPLTRLPGPAQRTTLGAILNTGQGNVFVHRSMLDSEHGSITPNPLPLDDKVIVGSFAATDHPDGAGLTHPDVRIHDGAEWWRMSGSGSAAGPGGGTALMVPGPIYLACPDNNEHLQGCDEDHH